MTEEKDASRQISNGALYCIMVTMLIFGTCNTIVMKWQDMIEVIVRDKDGVALPGIHTFTHPYFQCANMFVGELTCLFVYFLKLAIWGSPQKKVEDGTPLSPGGEAAQASKLKTKINPLLLAIPACCDICGSTLMFVALTQCAASVYQMMRGIIVVITAGMSIAFLGAKQYAHHWISLMMIVTGVAIVGIVSVTMGKKDDSADGEPATSITGVLLLLLAQCFTGCQFIAEEKLLGGYYLDPFLVVGLEGFWGSCIYAVLLPIFQNVKCDGPLCHNHYLEDSKSAFQQMGENKILILQSVFIIISIASFNATGVAITKYATAAQRSTVDTSRTLIIWVVSLALKWEDFLWPELIGFILLVVGTLIYNEIVVIPVDFMSQNTREVIKAREAKAGRLGAGIVDDDQKLNYIATSPGAAYDKNRGLRAIKAKQGERVDLLNKHGDKPGGEMYIQNDTPATSDGKQGGYQNPDIREF